MEAKERSAQWFSRGDSCPAVHRAALEAALPRPGLTWLDIGCGTGELLRMILSSCQPAGLTAVDVIDWLDDDLRPHVELITGPAEQVLVEPGQRTDRVLLVEAMEHVEAPWSLLRAAARRVAPGGRIVITTPNIASLRHRLELLTRGRLTAFRPDNLPHMTPVLPHVVERVLREEGMQTLARAYAGRDVVPWTGGRSWPRTIHARFLRATSVSVVISAERHPGTHSATR
jgi:2-polyprenyl-3-methyl-5-hydroxy-6-metoxy-1,4-benzoquinol methylase